MLADLPHLLTVLPGPEHVCVRTLFVAGPASRAAKVVGVALRKGVYRGAYVTDGQSTLELVCTLAEAYAVIDEACRAGPEYDTELLAACAIVAPHHCPHRPEDWPDCPTR